MPYKLGDGELFRSLLQHKLRPTKDGVVGKLQLVRGLYQPVTLLPQLKKGVREIFNLDGPHLFNLLVVTEKRVLKP